MIVICFGCTLYTFFLVGSDRFAKMTSELVSSTVTTSLSYLFFFFYHVQSTLHSSVLYPYGYSSNSYSRLYQWTPGTSTTGYPLAWLTSGHPVPRHAAGHHLPLVQHHPDPRARSDHMLDLRSQRRCYFIEMNRCMGRSREADRAPPLRSQPSAKHTPRNVRHGLPL